MHTLMQTVRYLPLQSQLALPSIAHIHCSSYANAVLGSPPIIRPTDLFHRVARRNTYCCSTFACHKHSLSTGWRSQSSLSSKQGYPVERHSGQGSGRTRIQRESKGSSVSSWLARSIAAKESRRISDWRIHGKIRRMGYV